MDSIEKQLQKIGEQVEKDVEDLGIISYEDLFTDSFIKQYSQFNSLDELLQQENLDISLLIDLASTDINKSDEFIKTYTKFSSWEEMESEAKAKYLVNNIDYIEEL